MVTPCGLIFPLFHSLTSDNDDVDDNYYKEDDDDEVNDDVCIFSCSKQGPGLKSAGLKRKCSSVAPGILLVMVPSVANKQDKLCIVDSELASKGQFLNATLPFDFLLFFSETLNAVYPSNMASFDLKLWENAFQTIPDI